jgi:hypothetical protein
LPRAQAAPEALPCAALRTLRDATTHTLATRVVPREADHSFGARSSAADNTTQHNAKPRVRMRTLLTASRRCVFLFPTPAHTPHVSAGVIWDVHANSHSEVTVTSVSVGGMLGRVRIFARAGSWRGDTADHAARLIATGWGQRYDLDATGWALVADEECAPSWDIAREIRLSTPVRILPHHTRALFIHSNLPDDLGIQYQTYRGLNDILARDDHCVMLPGLGFTGSVPFDTRRGWYRAYRGLAGALGYTASPLRWSAPRHGVFPAAARAAVCTLLCAQRRPESPLSALPKHLLLTVLEHCHWDWFVPTGANPPLGGTLEGGGAHGGARAPGEEEAGPLLDDEEMEEEDEEGEEESEDDDWEEDSDDGEYVFE